MIPVVKYSKSKDGYGLVAHLADGATYHVHNDEMTDLEKWIYSLLGHIENVDNAVNSARCRLWMATGKFS